MLRQSPPMPDLPEPIYGRGLLPELDHAWLARPLVHTQPEAWPLVRDRFAARARVQMAETMDLEDLEAGTPELARGASAVFGIGGGMALDRAKFTAWKTGLPLILLPAILSVDAAYTREIGVRVDSRVKYIGAVVPDRLLIDFSILEQAPPILNKAGVGDILSIFTALWDWSEAAARLGEPYDPETAARARAALERLLAGAGLLAGMGEDGLRLLSELFADEVRFCTGFGCSRPEEGSEHYLAYCIESMVRRPFIHGRLISLCVLVVGAFQGRELGPVIGFLDAIGLEPTLGALGLGREELVAALMQMKSYLEREPQLPPGVFHFRDRIDRAEAESVLDSLSPVIGA